MSIPALARRFSSSWDFDDDSRVLDSLPPRPAATATASNTVAPVARSGRTLLGRATATVTINTNTSRNASASRTTTARRVSNTSTSTTTTTRTRPSRIISHHEHYNVSCDECGVLPIVGNRYKSLRQPNYDVCHQCLRENHNGDPRHFRVLEKPSSSGSPSSLEDEIFEENLRNAESERDRESSAASTTTTGTLTTTTTPTYKTKGRSVSFHSTFELAAELRQDMTSDQGPTLEDFTLYVGTLLPHGLEERVPQAIAEHTRLKSAHIYIYGATHATSTIQALVKGLKSNTSIQTVAWHIHHARPEGLGLSQEAVTAFQELVQINQTIQFMFFKKTKIFGRFVGLGNSNTNTEENLEEDSLADALFDALATSSLHTFRYEGHAPVTDANKEKAWHAIQTSPKLQRIKAQFVTPDTHLEFLQLAKKHAWMERWTTGEVNPQPQQPKRTRQGQLKEDHDATTGRGTACKSIAPTDENRWKALEEALGADLDKTNVLYQFLNTHPGWLFAPFMGSNQTYEDGQVQVWV